jgi:SAM-dependent methyltransferase
MSPADQTRLFLKHLHNLASAGYWFERALTAELRRFLATGPGSGPGSGALVVDFGCGARPLARVFEGFAGCVLGVDVYPGGQVDVVYDGRRLPLADASVDLVFASSAFEHIDDLAAALAEIARVLRPGGRLAAVAPFVGHVHGAPFDYHRPTRFGWQSLLASAFPGAHATLTPVDDRLTCAIGLITAQLNFVLYDLLRWAARRFGYRSPAPGLSQGGASPEGGARAPLRAAYALARLNPLNFLLGLAAWLVAWIGFRRPAEGEITSGYLIVVEKP